MKQEKVQKIFNLGYKAGLDKGRKTNNKRAKKQLIKEIKDNYIINFK